MLAYGRRTASVSALVAPPFADSLARGKITISTTEWIGVRPGKIDLNVTDVFMRIGLLSDTHGFLDDALITNFRECDEIWHAGDFGTSEVLDQLNRLKPGAWRVWQHRWS